MNEVPAVRVPPVIDVASLIAAASLSAVPVLPSLPPIDEIVYVSPATKALAPVTTSLSLMVPSISACIIVALATRTSPNAILPLVIFVASFA